MTDVGHDDHQVIATAFYLNVMCLHQADAFIGTAAAALVKHDERDGQAHAPRDDGPHQHIEGVVPKCQSVRSSARCRLETQAGDAHQQAGERGRINADGLKEALQSAAVGGRQGGIAEMLRRKPEIDRARQAITDDDDSHGFKTCLVQAKVATQNGSERVDGMVMHLKDSSW